ncbi:hypothetical protein [Paenibacillus aceris]|uniref:Uncharacterized protein n=1 Tax=Paenibacillus aceris TaxID=869555 RepID=A0ABS4I4B7_9BACL|nr:hypothetical protein [Paenibacillus aceris]MBP1965366.1 hypothetical protein [Paenibacillus aceris]NHW36048.1 hypothetical protein [Paenibacillus aceris]
MKRYFDGKLYALPLYLFRREAGNESVAGSNERVSSIVGDMEAIAAKNKDVNTLLLEVDGRFKKRRCSGTTWRTRISLFSSKTSPWSASTALTSTTR